MDFRNYRLRFRECHMSSYENSHVNSWNKKLTVEMESYLLNHTGPTLVLDFLQTFWRACNNLRFHKGSEMFLLSHFMMVSSMKDLHHRTKCWENKDEEPDIDNERWYVHFMKTDEMRKQIKLVLGSYYVANPVRKSNLSVIFYYTSDLIFIVPFHFGVMAKFPQKIVIGIFATDLSRRYNRRENLSYYSMKHHYHYLRSTTILYQ